MKINETIFKQRRHELRLLFEQLTAGEAFILNGLSRIESRRANRIRDIEHHLEAKLGKEHPDVVILQEERRAAEEAKKALRVDSERSSRRPRIGAEDWMLYGCVTNPSGEPISGILIHLINKYEKPEKIVFTATSDEYGDFAIIVRKADLADYEKAKTTWRVTATGSDGTVLFISDQDVQFHEGLYKSMNITLQQKE